MIEKEFRYYVENRTELSAKYEGKVLVIKDQKVIGVYHSESEALKKTVGNHDLGTFLIQACSSDPNSVVNTFHSRVRLPSAV